MSSHCALHGDRSTGHCAWQGAHARMQVHCACMTRCMTARMQAFYTSGHPAPRILRALGAGIILSLACIHIIPEAVMELAELGALMGDHPYNVGGACVVFGVFCMVALEGLIHAGIDRLAKKKAAAAMHTSAKQHVAEGVDSHSHCGNVHGALARDPHTHVCVGHQSHLFLDGLPPQTRRDQVR